MGASLVFLLLEAGRQRGRHGCADAQACADWATEAFAAQFGALDVKSLGFLRHLTEVFSNLFRSSGKHAANDTVFLFCNLACGPSNPLPDRRSCERFGTSKNASKLTGTSADVMTASAGQTTHQRSGESVAQTVFFVASKCPGSSGKKRTNAGCAKASERDGFLDEPGIVQRQFNAEFVGFFAHKFSPLQGCCASSDRSSEASCPAYCAACAEAPATHLTNEGLFVSFDDATQFFNGFRSCGFQRTTFKDALDPARRVSCAESFGHRFPGRCFCEEFETATLSQSPADASSKLLSGHCGERKSRAGGSADKCATQAFFRGQQGSETCAGG